MAEILAIVSKAVFEEDALVYGELIHVGSVWPTDRYVSKARAFNKLTEGGRIFLVTVRPPDRLWLVGVLEAPLFDGTEWVARAPNRTPVTDITPLRNTILFASGKGIAPGGGLMLAQSLQTPRELSPASAGELAAIASGARPVPMPAPAPAMPRENAGDREGQDDEDDDADEDEAPRAASIMPAVAILAPERLAAIEVEVERFAVLSDKMLEVYGLRLPEDLPYAAGFLMGLTPAERAEIETHVGRLTGVGSWFGDGDAGPLPGGDERLRDRIADDPPEFVPVFACRDGERWGLWYDDPEELPAGIARRARAKEAQESDAAEGCDTHFFQPSLLVALKKRLGKTDSHLRDSLLAVLGEVQRREAASVRERTSIPRPVAHRLFEWEMVGSTIAPHQPDRLDHNLLAINTRRAAYRSGSREVDTWIEQARSELRDGLTGFPLVLGHELHHVQKPQWRLAATELLLRAYSLLRRQALADVVRAMYLHQDPTLPIYELPLPHPVLSAAVGGDPEAITLALDESTPTAAELEDALSSAPTPAAIDAIIDHPAYAACVASGASVDVPIRRRMRARDKSGEPKFAAKNLALIARLMERATASARVFASVVESWNAELIVVAAHHADLASTFKGASPLHLAARGVRPDAVKVLLDRGADPNAKSEEGKTAYDFVREALIERPSDSGVTDILMLFERAQGGPRKPPPPKDEEVEYAEGDTVHHKKLGEGIVESVTGEGDEARLMIRFATETRAFLAKFVTPGG